MVDAVEHGLLGGFEDLGGFGEVGGPGEHG